MAGLIILAGLCSGQHHRALSLADCYVMVQCISQFHSNVFPPQQLHVMVITKRGKVLSPPFEAIRQSFTAIVVMGHVQ